MTRPELDEPWEWRRLLIECPMCGTAMHPDRAPDHANWHWLTQTETKTLH